MVRAAGAGYLSGCNLELAPRDRRARPGYGEVAWLCFGSRTAGSTAAHSGSKFAYVFFVSLDLGRLDHSHAGYCQLTTAGYADAPKPRRGAIAPQYQSLALNHRRHQRSRLS